MSPMAVTGSIFSHDEISAAGRERLKGERPGMRQKVRGMPWMRQRRADRPRVGQPVA
ncbi:hypothetical protein K0M31_009957 [Melipona bicolor]|uniref:Uncharacterized protein n=1 Tax=Melipona bicolor TaxID=60889 RepID=A0AA40FMX0_9HYME|nr:hypothetical protein K0M31_009957 [Melipona bicolor]